MLKNKTFYSQFPLTAGVVVLHKNHTNVHVALRKPSPCWLFLRDLDETILWDPRIM